MFFTNRNMINASNDLNLLDSNSDIIFDEVISDYKIIKFKINYFKYTFF